MPFPAIAWADASGFKHSVETSIEGRVFLEDAAFAGQSGSGVSIATEPEFDYASSRDSALRFVAFGRWDPHDDERSHADIREATLRVRHGSFDAVAGIGHVFWGVTESVHLVDIVNQTDLVENPDGEDKLGQPMASLMGSSAYGNLTGYVLPWFRERRLPGVKGRLRAPLPYDRGKPIYESGAEERHVDGAVRYALSRGPMDLGLSYFDGTARDPRFIVQPAEGGAVLRPVYDQIRQAGLDLNLVSGAWLWKLEAVAREDRVGDYAAAAGGFEYTFSGAFGSAWDAGWLLELLWDQRGEDGPSPFQNDVFLATRWSGNDVAGTELLAGVVIDADNHGVFASIEASRRIGGAGRLALELRVFDGAGERDPLQAFDRDDYLQIEYTRYW